MSDGYDSGSLSDMHRDRGFAGHSARHVFYTLCSRCVYHLQQEGASEDFFNFLDHYIAGATPVRIYFGGMKNYPETLSTRTYYVTSALQLLFQDRKSSSQPSYLYE